MSILKRVSLPDQLYEELKRRIISLELPLGSRLNASELQKEFNVSSTPVREAINRLSQEELIIYENNIGARVLDLTEKDIREITEVNFAWQAEAMRLAMRKGKNNEIADQIEISIAACERAGNQANMADTVMKIMDVFFVYADNSRLNNRNYGLASQHQLLINLCLKALAQYHENFLNGLENYRLICNALRKNDFFEAIDILEKISYHGQALSVQGLAIVKEGS